MVSIDCFTCAGMNYCRGVNVIVVVVLIMKTVVLTSN